MHQREITAFAVGALLTAAAASIMALFFRADSSQIWDILKLIIQGLGALFITWMAVHWALGRFKSEKMWERQTKALADVLVAIREMEFINDSWLDEELRRNHYSEESDKPDPRSDRYQAAHRQLREVAAIAAIVLPLKINSVITQLERELAADFHDTWTEQLEHDGSAIRKAREHLLELGKQLR